MTERMERVTNKATETQVLRHLRACDSGFVPALSGRVSLQEYARKIVENAVRFEAWADGELIGLVAAYFDDATSGSAFITNVSVVPGWSGRGGGSALLSDCIDAARRSGMRSVVLEVGSGNERAIALYKKFGFVTGAPRGENIQMELVLTREA
jgi:ribosomal protein S18 acetylase RimI-like enzyme